jgi:hypothetical protein
VKKKERGAQGFRTEFTAEGLKISEVTVFFLEEEKNNLSSCLHS